MPDVIVRRHKLSKPGCLAVLRGCENDYNFFLDRGFIIFLFYYFLYLNISCAFQFRSTAARAYLHVLITCESIESIETSIEIINGNQTLSSVNVLRTGKQMRFALMLIDSERHEEHN